MTRRPILMICWLAAGWLVWRLLGLWIVGGSERLLLIVPPAFFTAWLILSENGWQDVRPHLRPLALLLGVIVLAVLSSFVLSSLRFGSAMLRWQEIFIATYYLWSIVLMLGAAWWGLGQVLLACARRIKPDLVNRPRLSAWLQLHVPAAVVIVMALPFVLALMQVHRVKVPNPYTPLDAAGRDFEEARFTSSDGLGLRGWFVPARAASTRTLLVCHGLSGCRSGMLGWLPLADELKANLFLFDLRGHGDSDGHTVTFGYLERHDVCAAVDYLRRQKARQARELIGAGQSLGAVCLLGAAALVEPPFDALVVDSSFATVDGVAENVVGGFPLSVRRGLAVVGVPMASLITGCPLERTRPIDWISDVRAPILLIHAEDDRLIPVTHARRLHERATGPCLLWIVPAGHHCCAFANKKEYLARVKALVDGNQTPSGEKQDERRRWGRDNRAQE